MSGIRSTLSTLVLAGLVAAAPISTALAQNAEAVAESLRALMERQGVKTEWSDVEESGATITLQDVTITPAGTDDTLSLGDVVLEDVSEEGDHYRVGEVTLPSYEQKVEGGITARLEDMSVAGLILPKDVDNDPFAGVTRYEHAQIGSMTVLADDKQLFSLTGLDVQMMTPAAQDGALEFRGTAKNFSADLEAATKDDTKEALEKLGYGQITGHAEMAGSWRPSDGRLMLSQYDLTVDDAGTFGLTLDMSGYTSEFMKAMREMGEQLDSASDEQKSAQALALLGMAQQLTLHGAMIRFADDSLTNKVLGYVAKQQGSSPADVANQLKALIPLQLAPYLGTQLAGQVTDAVTRYLDNPQSLEIRAEPEKPIPFQMLMAAAVVSPETLAKQLGLRIIANKAE